MRYTGKHRRVPERVSLDELLEGRWCVKTLPPHPVLPGHTCLCDEPDEKRPVSEDELRHGVIRDMTLDEIADFIETVCPTVPLDNPGAAGA